MYMDVIREHEEFEEARKEMRHNELEGTYLDYQSCNIYLRSV